MGSCASPSLERFAIKPHVTKGVERFPMRHGDYFGHLSFRPRLVGCTTVMYAHVEEESSLLAGGGLTRKELSNQNAPCPLKAQGTHVQRATVVRQG